MASYLIRSSFMILITILIGSEFFIEYVYCGSVENSDVAASFNPCLNKYKDQKGFGPEEKSSQGWILYRDEKCVKLYTEELLNYAETVDVCKRANKDSHLISISSQDEQDFIERLLRTKKIANNIWLSLKFNDDSDQYKWSDRTDFSFRNWGFGSPKNHSKYCVQMVSNPTGFGTWTEVSCAKRNFVLCQKPYYWTIARLQTEVLNLMRNSIPIGYVYVQYRKEDPPEKFWPLAKWAKITASIHDPGILWKRIK